MALDSFPPFALLPQKEIERLIRIKPEFILIHFSFRGQNRFEKFAVSHCARLSGYCTKQRLLAHQFFRVPRPSSTVVEDQRGVRINLDPTAVRGLHLAIVCEREMTARLHELPGECFDPPKTENPAESQTAEKGRNHAHTSSHLLRSLIPSRQSL